nr:PREDICTED: dedicator of cytokinesis protein 1-like [Struthio camelus australis]
MSFTQGCWVLRRRPRSQPRQQRYPVRAVSSVRRFYRGLLRDFIGNLPPQRLLKQKLQSLTDIVNSKIFQSYECREMLLHTAVSVLQELIERGEEEDACIELLSNILEVLYKAQKRAEEQSRQHSGGKGRHKEHGDSELVKVKKHIQLILDRLLHTVNRRVIVLDRENNLRFEDEILRKLDSEVEGGRGDEQYKQLFESM